MKVAAGVSVLLHGLLLAALLAHWRPFLHPPHEVPGKIEMIFGHNALHDGGPSSARPTAMPAAAASSPTPQAAVAVLPASAPSVRTDAMASPPASESVRLGDGAAGFDVPQPDAGIVEAQADPGNRPPRYPDGAFARREHGTVVLRIHIRPDGNVEYIETLRSSGFDDLDGAARLAAQRWHFIPQLRDGAAVASVRDQAMDFVLE